MAVVSLVRVPCQTRPMPHESVRQRLDRLTPDQREAATAPPGPVLCVAPAGSGKTTTLVARIAWLVDAGVDPTTITAITFNKRAAEELGERAVAALTPLEVAEPVRVRTFHALGREILRDAGRRVEPLIDRSELVAELWPTTSTAEPCGAVHYHGFYGIDDQAVAATVQWLRANMRR